MMPTKIAAQLEQLDGTVERVTFHNPDNGFCVLRTKVTGFRELVTITGNIPSITAGEHIECQGQWIHNREYGRQFQASLLKAIPPSTLEGMEKYLGSGLIKGIGKHFAKKLVQAFKEEVFNVIEQDPDRLLDVPGIGEYRKQKLVTAWDEQKMIREIMVFLQSHGIGTAKAVRIYKTYGENAIHTIRLNPYQLSKDIHGIGFKTADELAKRLGIAENAMIRIEAGVRHQLSEHSNQGHCAEKIEELILATAALLKVEPAQVKTAIDNGIQSETLIEETIDEACCVFLKRVYLSEKGVAKHIHRLLKGSPPWNILNQAAALNWVEKQNGVQLSSSQQAAIHQALSNKMTIITGGPGVGKTTVVNSILRIVSRKTQNIILCAPTGRAAKRLTESTGLEAKTIHRSLAFDPKSFGFKHNEHHPLAIDFIVIDEVSMIDLVLMHQLLKAIPTHAAVLMVGDADQLPSVGAGAILSDCLRSHVIPSVTLTEIFRQAAHSKIIVNAHRINQGKLPSISHTNPSTLTDFYFIEADEPEEIQRKLIQVVKHRIPERFQLDPIRDIQVLTPMNRGMLGTRGLNALLQETLNLQADHSVTRFGLTFQAGDKVIQLVNNYNKDVYNGDIGFIHSIDNETKTVHISFENRSVPYEFNELDEITLAYASTIHKSQGSEYPAVVIPMSTQHYTLLQKNLLYTAVTRGRKLVVIIGQKKAMGIAIKNRQANKRLTNLCQRLQAKQAESTHPAGHDTA